MRMLTTSIVIGPLLLIGGLAAAGQPPFLPHSSVGIQLVADEDSRSDRDSFTQKAQEQMKDWQRKLQDFNDKAKAKGTEVGTAADSDLHKAWYDAQAASRQLQTVGAEDWHDAKTSFERASSGLEGAWDRIRPRETPAGQP